MTSAMMMNVPETSNLKIPVDNIESIISHHSNIEEKITNTNKECGLLKNMMVTLLQSAVSPVKPACVSSALSVSPATSIASVDVISDVDDVTVIESSLPKPLVGDTSEDHTELFREFIAKANEGKLDLNDVFMQQLYEINARIDELNAVVSDLQEQWCKVDDTLKLLINEIENLKQYTFKESLLLHNFPLPPPNLTSLQYSMYVADKLNSFLPQLPVPVTSKMGVYKYCPLSSYPSKKVPSHHCQVCKPLHKGHDI